MAQYRSLGPITFLDETQAYEIFETSNNSYILQLKKNIHISEGALQELLKEQSDLQPEKFSSIDIRMFSQHSQSQALVIGGCEPFDFNGISSQNLCKVIDAMERTLRCWTCGKIGDIHRALFFLCNQQIAFISLPIFQQQQNPCLRQETINFLETICTSNQRSHKLLIDKLRSCKDLQSLFAEARYFSQIYKLKTSSRPSSLYSQKISLHLEVEQKSRGKYLLSKQRLTTFKAFGFNTVQESSHWNSRDSSQTCHFNRSYVSPMREQSSEYKSNNKQIIFKRGKIQNSLNSATKKGLLNSNSSLVASKNCNQNIYQRCKRNSKINQKTNCFVHPKQQSQKSIKADPNRNQLMKEMVNRSLQKWRRKQTHKIVITEHEIKQLDCRKKLKKTGYKHPESLSPDQFEEQKLLEDKLCENNSLQNSGKVLDQTEKQPQKKHKTSLVSNPTDSYNQARLQNDIQKISKSNENNSQFPESSLQNSRRPSFQSVSNQKTPKIVSKDHPQSSMKKKLRMQLQELDMVGEFVAKAASHVKSFPVMFYQLPMFLLYKEFYFRRLKVCESDFPQLKQENKCIQKGLKKLLKQSIKRSREKKDLHDSLQPHMNLDFSSNSKGFVKTIIEGYLESIHKALLSYPQLTQHFQQVIDAFLILQGEGFSRENYQLAMSNSVYQKEYLRERYLITCRKTRSR